MKRRLPLLVFLSLLALPAHGAGITLLPGHVPLKQMARAQELGNKDSSTRVPLAIVLNPKNPQDLEATLKSLYTPGDPLYHQFLTPDQFASRYGHTDQEISAIAQYLSGHGLNVTNTHRNHLVIDVEGSVSDIENTFQVELHEFIASDGRVVFAPTSDPLLSDEIAPSVNAIAGLNNFSLYRPHLAKNTSPQVLANVNQNTGMYPSRLKSVYGLSSLSQTGSGETLALFELDGYTSSDITAYETTYSLRAVPLTNVLVDGAAGTPSSGSDSGASEVTLDIELAIAMAPGLSKILVYEAPNSDAGLIDTYSKIANDNLANEVSTSWGAPEDGTDSSVFNSDNVTFQQMATQGQSIFAASGDSGAYGASPYGDNTDLQVQDPASQPYVTGVGGTTVTWNGSNAWSSETSWQTSLHTGTYGQSNYFPDEGGGGGISQQWSLPSWQSGLSTGSGGNKGSTTMRMVPDVSLDADPSTGYPIYYSGAWVEFGGTSCAAPLWAAFTALVNQQRVANGTSRIGFANPALYTIGRSGSSASNYHDIADASNNLYYPATTGYDLTTGWGTINGSTMFNSLVATVYAPLTPTLTVSPAALSIAVSWSAVTDATSYTLMRSTTYAGSYSSVYTGSATSYTDTSVTYGSTYYYYVYATDGAGNSSNSTIKAGTPAPVAPGAPSGLTASVVQ